MFQKMKIKLFKYFTRSRMFPYFDNNGKIVKNTRISSSVLFIEESNISIGENIFIWQNTILDGSGKLTISEGCQIGANVSIFTHSSHFAIRLFGRYYAEKCFGEVNKGYIKKEVFVGKYTFIATGSIILPGVNIGKGVIIAPNSVVNINLPDYSIVQGNPCVIIGDTRKIDKKYLKNSDEFTQYYNEWNIK